jgi:DNA modification methylase
LKNTKKQKKMIDLIQSELIQTSKLLLNSGQLEGVPKNPRFIKDERYTKLIRSIQDDPEMLGARELLVYPYKDKFVVLGGNMRLRGCKELGIKEVPCKVLPELTPDKLRSIVIKDNVAFGSDDFDMLANDWDIVELVEWGMEIPSLEEIELEAEEDDYTEPEQMQVDVVLGDLVEFVCKDGRVHRLLCGDSTDSDAVAKLMDGEKADMVFTDPPYGINAVSKSGVLKETYKDDILGDSDTNAARDSFSLAYSLYPEASHIWWGANHYTFDAKLPNAKCWITWDKQEKNNHIDQADCELAWTNINSPARVFHHLWAGFRRDSEIGEKRVHPTQKPIQLICEILQHFKKVNSALILDLFLGSGSTLVASHQLNRICYGMELDPKYCQVIIDRMQKLDNTIKVNINGKEYLAKL